MKKKIILGKKLFLNKETITGLTDQESLYVKGGHVPSSPSAGCLVQAPQTGTANTCEASLEGGSTLGYLCIGDCNVTSIRVRISRNNGCGGWW